jgi:hypothetical protein
MMPVTRNRSASLGVDLHDTSFFVFVHPSFPSRPISHPQFPLFPPLVRVSRGFFLLLVEHTRFYPLARRDVESSRNSRFDFIPCSIAVRLPFPSLQFQNFEN